MENILIPENIAFILGIFLSALFELWPKAKTWFDKLTSGQKFMFMSVGGLAVVAIFFGLSCGNLFGLGELFTCDSLGAQDAFLVWLTYFLANQGTFATLHAVKKSRS